MALKNMNTRKKIIIVTLHSVINAGSALQAFATEYILAKLNCSTTILNYIPYRLTLLSHLQNMDSLKQLLTFPGYVIYSIVYAAFRKKNLHLSRRFYSIRAIEKNCPEADIYMTGSAQVWNSAYNTKLDGVYYWEFLRNNEKKISFSSSFGRSELPQDEAVKVKEMLSSYSHLSVREHSAQVILEKMGLENVNLTLDPTLLLRKDEWKETLIGKPIVENPYLLVYIPYNVSQWSDIEESVKLISGRTGLKVVTLSVWNTINADKCFRIFSPQTFLNVFYYAEYILTNSFHGTAFSINFNKQFAVIQPKEYSTRIENLLNIVSLKRRYFKGVVNRIILDEIIDYDSVNTSLNMEREKTIRYLKTAISK